MRQYLSISLLFLWLSTPVPLCARLRASPGQEDVRDLAKRAPLVFRGQVVQLQLTRDEPEVKEGIAVVSVERWYRGNSRSRSSSRVRVHFVYAGNSFDGHNCVNLAIDSFWIFFAQPHNAVGLELFDDCEGALAVSPLHAPRTSDDALSQMEADFKAGLGDSDPEARLASIQRLAGLGMSASREALLEVISQGSEKESKWALFALLQTGDGSAVSLAVPLLLSLRHDKPGPYPQPEVLIALALQKLRDPTAVPKLIEILDGAPDEIVRSCASQALSEIKDPRALDSLADHLSDQFQYVRYNSLVGMGYMTHAPPCTVTDPKDAEKAEPLCKSWWKSNH